jgi:hypothetical protein
MPQKQEEAITDLKLDEKIQVKDNLIRMNEYKPNLSFRQANLNEYSFEPFN